MEPFFWARLCLATALTAPSLAVAANTQDDIRALREEMQASQAAYEARLQALEQQLRAEQAKAVTPAKAQTSDNANTLNPAISLILSGLYTHTSRSPSNYHITGFGLPAQAEIGPGQRSFSLGETELGLAASVDPWWQGQAHIALHPDHSVSVEEAYVNTTALAHGLSLKAGRFFSGLGYLNAQHAHTWDFVDNPLAYQAMLGTQYAQDGVQLTWLAPSERFIQLGLELGRGQNFPGGERDRNGPGAWALTAHTGGDLGDSHTWRTGLSLLQTKAQDQERLTPEETTGEPISASFTGRTRTLVLDGVWKWAPHGNATRINFKLQGEYLHSQLHAESTPSTTQTGWYLQGIYQFSPRWRVGLRTEQLRGLSAYHPSKHNLMLDYHTSEFSRLRLQVAQDRARQNQADHQFFLQYQMSLGAHGAHAY